MPSTALRNVVLDTDTFNEIDDQFALAHLLLSPEQINLEAVYAAPFLNSHSTSPADGMEKSHEEIHRVLDVVAPRKIPPVFRGSQRFMQHDRDVVESDVVSDLVDRAMQTRDGKLYVLAIAAPTNVAAALLAEPKIAEKIVVVWLGGHAPYWQDTREFNLRQDIHASRIILEAKAPLVLLPCYPVASHLLTTVPELEARLAPTSKVGAYLTKCMADYTKIRSELSRSIWDMAATAWAVQPEWVPTTRIPSPILRDDFTWDKPDPARAEIDVAIHLHRDAIFSDLFAKAKSAGA